MVVAVVAEWFNIFKLYHLSTKNSSSKKQISLLFIIITIIIVVSRVIYSSYIILHFITDD